MKVTYEIDRQATINLLSIAGKCPPANCDIKITAEDEIPFDIDDVSITVSWWDEEN